MNKKQRNNHLKYLQDQKSKLELIEEETIVFPYTEQYIMKRQMMKVAAPIGFGILGYFILYIFTEYLPMNWFCGVLWIVSEFFCIVGMMVYGGMGRIYHKDDIFIKNNRIYFKCDTKTNYGRSINCFVFKTIQRVIVKRNKIMIYGDIWDELDFKKPLNKKLAFPKEIENVEEFIRFAQSQVVKE